MGPGEIDPSQHQGGELAGIAPPHTTTNARVTFDRAADEVAVSYQARRNRAHRRIFNRSWQVLNLWGIDLDRNATAGRDFADVPE